MKNTFILLISFTVLSITVSAQDNYGYYGKKNFIDLSSSSYVSLIYGLTNLNRGAELRPSGNSLSPYTEWFNTGARVSIGRAIESNVGLALELGFDRFRLSDRVLYGSEMDGYTYIENHESLITNSILILPRIEISGRNGLLPNGLVHQIGVGFTINSIAKKNYLVEYNNGTISGGPNGASADQDALFKDNNMEGSVRFAQLMYGLKTRTPIGKSLMLNYGIRYTLDFGFTSYEFNRDVAGEIREYLFRNIIAFDLGLTLPF